MDFCVRSKELAITNEDHSFILTSVTYLCEKYMQSCYPEQAGGVLGMDFANYVLEIRATWNVFDLVNFFKFIKYRKDIKELRVFGNTINLDRLIEFSCVYENHRLDKQKEVREQEKPKDTFQRKGETKLGKLI